MRRHSSAEVRKVHKKSHFLSRFILLIVLLFAIAGISLTAYFFVNKKLHSGNSVLALYDHWKERDYRGVYDISGKIIESNTFHNAARTFRGYSAFYLAESETDNTQAQKYFEESINNLRLALQSAKKNARPQIQYMLGKAYFYKDKFSSYPYYADLVVKYMVLAGKAAYKADDMAEMMGLCYDELGDTQKSIESFTEALLVRESDTLLYNIAKQYYKNSQGSIAQQYLYRVENTTKNDDLLLGSHLLLGQISLEQGSYKDAQKEFEWILQKDENFADAHYGLGVLYEKTGDMAKARAEWRKTLRLQVNHPGALQKMSESK